MTETHLLAREAWAIADSTLDAFGIAATDRHGDLVSITLSATQAEMVIIGLLQRLYAAGHTPRTHDQGASLECVKLHGIGLGAGEAGTRPFLLLDIGPVRLPVELAQTQLGQLADLAARGSLLLGPPEGSG